jgi:hypothetical protein
MAAAAARGIPFGLIDALKSMIAWGAKSFSRHLV